MMRESEILFQRGDYWICRAPKPRKGFEIYRDGVTHATRCGVIGFEGEEGMARAKAEIARRLGEVVT